MEITISPSRYYAHIRLFGLFFCAFSLAFFLPFTYALTPLGGVLGLIVVASFAALDVLLVGCAIYLLSDVVWRRITVSEDLIIDHRGFPFGARAVRRQSIFGCRLEVPDEDTSRPGWEAYEPPLVYLTNSPLGSLLTYAKQQKLVLLGADDEPIGRIDMYGFEDRQIARLAMLLQRKERGTAGARTDTHEAFGESSSDTENQAAA